MLRRSLRRPSHATVVAYLALFVAVGTGGAYAANTVRSSDIVDGQVNSADVKDQSLTTFDVSTFLGADIVDGTITARDIGINGVTHSDFGVTIGTVGAQSCKYFPLPGFEGSTGSDHLVVTPQFVDSSINLIYTVEAGTSYPYLKICNPTPSAINDGFTSFDVLAIAEE